jgi:hypothetical protein
MERTLEEELAGIYKRLGELAAAEDRAGNCDLAELIQAARQHLEGVGLAIAIHEAFLSNGIHIPSRAAA